MKKNKLVEVLSLSVFVFIALHFFIFPGLESDNFFLNTIALTSFFLLVVLVVFGGMFTGSQDDPNS